MTAWGWVFLVVSWLLLTYWTAWCMFKVFKAPFVPEHDEDEGLPPSA